MARRNAPSPSRRRRVLMSSNTLLPEPGHPAACRHTLPDLAKREKKYADQLVVVGIHSAKFENEKDSDNIRKAILRYEISHPVVNDAYMRIWRTYLGREGSWPTLVLIDPEGNA